MFLKYFFKNLNCRNLDCLNLNCHLTQASSVLASFSQFNNSFLWHYYYHSIKPSRRLSQSVAEYYLKYLEISGNFLSTRY